MKLLLGLALLFPLSVKQTTDEFGQKYKPHESGGYIVRPGIVMKVEATASGNACEAIIKPLASTVSKEPYSPVMPPETAKEVLDEIIPEIKRGKFIMRGNANGGCAGWDIIGYEKATIGIVTRCKEQGGGVYSAWIQWIRDECPVNKPLKWND
jgi:hypothetical protein